MNIQESIIKVRNIIDISKEIKNWTYKWSLILINILSTRTTISILGSKATIKEDRRLSKKTIRQKNQMEYIF